MKDPGEELESSQLPQLQTYEAPGHTNSANDVDLGRKRVAIPTKELLFACRARVMAGVARDSPSQAGLCAARAHGIVVVVLVVVAR